MRYFIEVKPIKSIISGGFVVHASRNPLSHLPLCFYGNTLMGDEMEETDGEVTCKRCLKILEKWGRIKD